MRGEDEERSRWEELREGTAGGVAAARNRKASLAACCRMMTKVAAATAGCVDNCHADKCDVVEYERYHVHDDTRVLKSPGVARIVIL